MSPYSRATTSVYLVPGDSVGVKRAICDSQRAGACTVHISGRYALLVERPKETMMTSEEMVSRLHQFAKSGASRDDVLKFAVGVMKEERPHYNWVGIYLLEGDTLVLHNYEGKPTEHTHIPVGVGVCGTAVAEKANQIVGDVTTLDNYLACSLETRAEIVVLIRKGEQIFGQIDIDSDIPDVFTNADEALLNRVADVLADTLL